VFVRIYLDSAISYGVKKIAYLSLSETLLSFFGTSLIRCCYAAHLSSSAHPSDT